MDDKFTDLAERIAALEEQAEHGQRDRNEMKLILVHTDKNLNELINKISKWEGKFGGVIFAISCLWIFLTGLPSTIMDWIRLRGGG